MQKTIYINGRFLTHPITGVQRYSHEVIRHMDSILGESPQFQDTKFVCLAPPEKIELPGWKNIEVRRVGSTRGNIWEQVDLPRYARGQLLFSPANSGPWHYPYQVITIQDAAVFAVPRSYSLPFRAKYWFLYGQLARSARRLLTVSEFSRAELEKHLRIPPGRLTVIPSGSGHLARTQADTQVLTDHRLQKNCYWLLVVSPHRHKNIAVVEQAISWLGQDQIVVVAGVDADTARRIRGSASDPAGFLWLGHLDDGRLKTLYENARALIVPSMYEGFGLPVLEAMHCGCPVICAHAGALPEVASDAALYFDPHDPLSLAALLGRAIAEPDLAEHMRKRGFERSNSFTWSRCAQLVLEVLAGAAAEGGRQTFSPIERSLKRVIDLALVCMMLPMIAMLMFLIALAIRLDSHGPALYSQERLGRAGRKIQIWKFRSMAVNADEILEAFLAGSPQMREEWEADHKLKNDPRITRIGRILRRTSLDELPQFWNILRGEMSLSGPRPIVEEELELYGKDFEVYKQAVPGLTGLWQVSGRNDLTYEERVCLDVHYVQNWSIWLDLRILVQTILVIIQGRGAY
jgi:lipopolysaccharide/colanic/teichoic acid biosynthesis glycosyltransferase/glycosyltransferase involved in cell wall biosynthesis